MNKSDYEKMLEIPENTLSITVKPNKKRVRKEKKIEKLETAKEKLINKINEKTEEKIVSDLFEEKEEVKALPEAVSEEKTSDFSSVKIRKKRRFFNVITVELAVIGLLAAFIVLSGVFFKNTFINS